MTSNEMEMQPRLYNESCHSNIMAKNETVQLQTVYHYENTTLYVNVLTDGVAAQVL